MITITSSATTSAPSSSSTSDAARYVSGRSRTPSPSRSESTSVVSESWIPASQTAAAAAAKMTTRTGSESDENIGLLLSGIASATRGYAGAVVSPAVDNLVAQLTRL